MERGPPGTGPRPPRGNELLQERVSHSASRRCHPRHEVQAPTRYSSDCEREMRGPLRISFRFSSFFLRFSSSRSAFWKVSALGKNCRVTVWGGQPGGAPAASQRHNLPPQTHWSHRANPPRNSRLDVEHEWGPDVPMGQVATGGGRCHQAPKTNPSPVGEFDAHVSVQLPPCWGFLAFPRQATHSLPQPAAWSCNWDGEAHGARWWHHHLTSEWSVLKGLR